MTIMDKIFTSRSTDAKSLLLRVICDFLVSQSAKAHIESADEDCQIIDIQQLIGNNEKFADSG